jgi:hypothetical protein
MQLIRPFLIVAIALCAAPLLSGADAAPATVFDLREWKLQIPGPLEIKSLQGYSSDHFDLTPAREMHFHLDAAEKGATQNAHYVRSELRHLPNWKMDGIHTLSGEFRVTSSLTPNHVTALQIHGIMPNGEDAPPLLRVAVNDGDLVAALKTDATGDKTETIVLKKQIGEAFVKVDVSVRHKQLKISVNHQAVLSRNLAFWPYENYFKAGCYPQASAGIADIYFRKLTAQ